MATAAAIPPPGPPSPTLKTSATWSAAAKPPSANKPPPPSRSHTSQTIARRGVRSADYLSDKATAAFIRRTLCAKHLAERGRFSPAPIEELLPPLTSRNDVDLQLYALISVILKEFVQKWYSNITPDETFVAEIVQIIAHFTRALEERLRNVDLESLLFDQLPELLDAHVRAYRTASNSAAKPPLEANFREIYHSLWPLPALSPLPKPGDARSVQAQADNEAAYRQLLVQGVLALLLPTEDLENECLTSLVGQIFSELIIGNLVAKKLSEPWLLLEIFIMLTRLAKGGPQPPESPDQLAPTTFEDEPIEDGTLPMKSASRSSPSEWFWSLVQLGFLVVNIIRLLASTWVLSRSLPPRTETLFVQKPVSTDQQKSEKSYNPISSHPLQAGPTRVPIAEFKLWPCVANLLEMDARMPWLGGAFSMMQWSATKGPGQFAGYNGVLDRLFSHCIQTSVLDSDRLPPLLRSIRAALFPNNAPGVSTLFPPSSEEELVALRRRCASAIWGVIPKSMGRVYFGSVSLWTGSQRWSPTYSQDTKSLAHDPEVRPSQRGKSASGNHGAVDDGSIADEHKDAQASGVGRGSESHKKPGNQTPITPLQRRGSENKHRETNDDLSLSQALPDPEEERILSEIESGILDVFSDAYCNKHLIYGMLELILVRLMPELTEKGIIELWEERLS
ncbi:hypothetical protein PFICI_03783 [Pestalotiopsis fici W106-1]|uniref:PXA domain-containing protein n=1 Tax=Pestalotiopsis fici (strain W106-1 / CGMCC3.15140) TaxID=1229662 RepID=W3XI78_PESFW|nr:uncharacterized protein PFICI_03783 [Pestalotiopsis fici W106-1]ETS85758.1 hypothetical protein PFICI_03783 [Pestalotiopsis fici W106-1]